MRVQPIESGVNEAGEQTCEVNFRGNLEIRRSQSASEDGVECIEQSYCKYCGGLLTSESAGNKGNRGEVSKLSVEQAGTPRRTTVPPGPAGSMGKNRLVLSPSKHGDSIPPLAEEEASLLSTSYSSAAKQSEICIEGGQCPACHCGMREQHCGPDVIATRNEHTRNGSYITIPIYGRDYSMEHVAADQEHKRQTERTKTDRSNDRYLISARIRELTANFCQKTYVGHSVSAILTIIYAALVGFAAIFTYSLVSNLILAMGNPVRSISDKEMTQYIPPAVVFYPGTAFFLACGHYMDNQSPRIDRLSSLDLKNRTCSYLRIQYPDPKSLRAGGNLTHDVIIIRGPTGVLNNEALFVHFGLEDHHRDFFTVAYYLLPNWERVKRTDPKKLSAELSKHHGRHPSYSLSADMRSWIKLKMRIIEHIDGHVDTEFNMEESVAKFFDSRPVEERHMHLFFIFFEWKNDIISEIRYVYTETFWTVGASLCGVLLTAHKALQLSQAMLARLRRRRKNAAGKSKANSRQNENQMSAEETRV